MGVDEMGVNRQAHAFNNKLDTLSERAKQNVSSSTKNKENG